MNDNQLDQNLAALFADRMVSADPNGSLGRDLLQSIVEDAHRADAGVVSSEARPTVVAGGGDMVVEPERTEAPRLGSPSMLALAAAIVLFVGGITAALLIGRNGGEQVDSAASTGAASTGVLWTPPPSERSEGGIEGSLLPQIVIGPEALIGREQLAQSCLVISNWFSPLGGSVLNEVGYLEPAGDLSGVVMVRNDGNFYSCGSSGGGGSSFNGFLLGREQPFEIAGGDSQVPNFAGELVEAAVEGLLWEGVDRLEVIDGQDQVFRTDGTFFRLEWVTADGDRDPSSQEFRVIFDDGTEVTTRSTTNGEFAGSCDAATCFADQLALAEAAGATSQVEVLADEELTQAEYARQVVRFSECLGEAADYPFAPTDAAYLAEGSLAANAALACHDAELRYVEVARIAENGEWFATEEGGEAFLDALSGVPDLPRFGSTLYLADDITDDEVGGLINAVEALEIGAWRLTVGQEAYARFMEVNGGDAVLGNLVDPSMFPTRIDLVTTADDAFSTDGYRQIVSRSQVAYDAIVLSFTPWAEPVGSKVGIVDADLLPEGFGG